ncbi:MAG: anthranilate synthase component I family protein [Deltaproteobacteria bacterium]|nr:anthranilate synthase component I family protein [Deltaproteobacteria bacterium]
MRARKLSRIASERAARALGARPGFVWLDGDGSGSEGRLSHLASDPVEWLRVPLSEAQPLRALARLTTTDSVNAELGRAPRWMGYVAYDAGLDASLRARRPADQRALCFARYEATLTLDHASGEAWIVGEDAAACGRLESRLAAKLPEPGDFRLSELEATSRQRHERAILGALEEIAAGEIYQVNLARRWRARFSGSTLGLFLAMRRASPVPFGFYFDSGQERVLGRSMERFLGWEGRALRCRPIKGTIARSGQNDDDEAARLRSDTKERAEHSMIVDLVRNDLGRVAEVGSVKVTDLLSVEPYAGLSHLVSTVGCRTREDVRLVDVFEATFPPGSVTGTPKLRSMRTIEEREGFSRDVYTGAVGYISHAGDAHFAVAIRTAVERAGEVRYDAGGGLVALSDPARELEETELKARAFLDALREPSPEV